MKTEIDVGMSDAVPSRTNRPDEVTGREFDVIGLDVPGFADPKPVESVVRACCPDLRKFQPGK
jgi:hypothetical protein